MKRRFAGALILMLVLASCAKSTVEEVNSELSRLVDPALEAALAGSNQIPERLQGTDACSDPFFGPRQGVRPGVEFQIPLASLGDDPDSFAAEAAKVWEEMGLKVTLDRTDTVFTQIATKQGYTLNATVNHANGEALMSGTGPCVEDPDAG